MATCVVGLTYILLALAYGVGLKQPIMFLGKDNVKDNVKALVTILGAGLPAFGAAFFGIRATGDFRGAGEQAERTLVKLEDLKRRLEAE